jgi:hypothetical protein
VKRHIILLLLLVSCGEKPRVGSIEICAISPLSSAPHRTNAHDFFGWSEVEHFFKRRTITSRDSLSIILSLLENVEIDAECSGVGKGVDTKAVLLLNYPLSTDTVSANWNCILIKGKTYKTSEELKRIFWPSFNIPTFENNLTDH